jgi:hypothetical protein
MQIGMLIRDRHLVREGIISGLTRVHFVTDRIPHIILKGRLCDIVGLKVRAPTEIKCDYTNDRFCEELEPVFEHFPKNHMKILLEHFNAKAGRKDNFKLTTGNERTHETSNDNDVRVINFASLINQVLSSTISSQRKIHI